MTTKIFKHLQSREKTRLKKLAQLHEHVSLNDYFNLKSVFSNDSLYFGSFELFMNKKDKLSQGRYFIEEWIIFLMVNETISKWLINNSNLESVRILIPYCGSGTVTQIVIEVLFMYFKKIYPLEQNQILLEKIIHNNIHSWDIDSQCISITKTRIQSIFNVEPITKQTTTILENEKFDIVLGNVPFGDMLSQQFKHSINCVYDDILLNFIDWGLHSLKPNGEMFYFVGSYLSYDKNYINWRKKQYQNLTIHTVINFNSYQSQDNPVALLGLGFNNQNNSTITYHCLDNLFSYTNIPAEVLYCLDNNYLITLPYISS